MPKAPAPASAIALISIALVEPRDAHYYQPGWTLVASGVWPKERTIGRNADFLPPSAEWVKDFVAEFDPAANAVVTAGGQRIEYDFLVVATGLQLNYQAIEGMDVAAIGQNGLASVYASADAAAATWAAMDTFRAKGGRAVATMPGTPMKCAGAPIKIAFLLADRLKEAGTFAQTEMSFHAAGANIFSVKPVNDFALQRWDEMGIAAHLDQNLTAIDLQARRATFSSSDGTQNTVDYDFIHVVPPMSAPDAVRNSDLAWKEGNFAGGGWLEVDEGTLRHKRYGNVFGVGDINGTRRGKTAATVKGGAPIVATNLIDVINGREPSQRFNGYTSCPLILRVGSALLLEFDYEGNLTPTLPGIDPMKESFFAWMLKYRLLKPAYNAVLRGHA